MKKLVRLTLLAILAWIVPLGVFAQDDVTATYLVNPSFEEGTTFYHDSDQVVVGWNVSKQNLMVSYRNDDADATKDGSFIFGIWDPTNIGDFEISQTVKGLPAGTYVISCLMTVPESNLTTQRLFAKTSKGTFATYYNNPKDTVPGEKRTFSDQAVDGNGAGPFHPLSLKVDVAAGDSLILGIRTNGRKSVIMPAFSTLNGEGWFKVDRFMLSVLNDPNAFIKGQIQENIDKISAYPVDSLPGIFTSEVPAKIQEAQNVISSVSIADSLENYNNGLKAYLVTLAKAKTIFYKLYATLLNCEELTSKYSFPGKDALLDIYDDCYIKYGLSTSTTADFEKCNTDLSAAVDKWTAEYLPINLAMQATSTTSFCSSWEKLSAVNDGFEPASSTDNSHGKYGNWNGSGDYGKTNWIQYEWPASYKIQEVKVYWWTDFGGLSQPTTAYVEYWNGSDWMKAGDIDTAFNKFNALTINVSTSKIRLNMASATSVGVAELQAWGLRTTTKSIAEYKQDVQAYVNHMVAIKDSVPQGYVAQINTKKTEADAVIAGTPTEDEIKAFIGTLSTFNALIDSSSVIFKSFAYLIDKATVTMDVNAYANEDKLLTATNLAKTELASTSNLIGGINKAKADLQYAIDLYMLGGDPTNVALKATVTTSKVSSWEKLAAVNDGFEPTSSSDNTHGKYGNWSGAANYGETNWIQYEWTAPQQINTVSVYWFTDGGGLALPDTATIQYFDGADWQTAGRIDTFADMFNELAVNKQTTKIRLYMKSLTAVGVTEFKAMGFTIPTAVKPTTIESVNVYPTIVNRGGSMTIESKSNSKSITVEMYNLGGQRISGAHINSGSTSVTAPANAGLYLMVINTPEGKVFRKIMVK